MRECELGTLLEVLIDHRGKTPKKLGGIDFTDSGVPVVSAIHVKNGRINLAERRRFVPQWMFERWMPVRLARGDVLVTSEAATFGEIAQVETDEDLVLSQRLFALRGKRDVLDSSYLRYFLESDLGQYRLRERLSGSAVTGIRQSELIKVLVPVPTFEEQLRIASVLGALDGLTETNRALVRKLTETAVSCFRTFRPSSTHDVTYADIATIGGGGTPSTKNSDNWDGHIRWATPSDLTALSSPFLFDTSRKISAGGLAACSSGLYPAGTILMTSRATIGVFAIAQVSTAVNQGFIVVKPDSDADRTFLLLEMMHRVPDYLAHANGSTFLEISRGKFKALPLAWPSDQDRRRLHEQLSPLLAAAAELEVEVGLLTQTRAELLPLLMSGKVRVLEDMAVA